MWAIYINLIYYITGQYGCREDPPHRSEHVLLSYRDSPPLCCWVCTVVRVGCALCVVLGVLCGVGCALWCWVWVKRQSARSLSTHYYNRSTHTHTHVITVAKLYRLSSPPHTHTHTKHTHIPVGIPTGRQNKIVSYFYYRSSSAAGTKQIYIYICSLIYYYISS
jgi:hypothetical protein